jgi:hypothetical protein
MVMLQSCTVNVDGLCALVAVVSCVAPQLSISQKALGMLPEDGNVIPKHVGTTIHN